MGLQTVAEAMDHPLLSGLFRKVELQEIVPHVTPVPGMTPAAYVDLIAARFSNPMIVDTIRRIAFDGSSRHTGMVLPTVRDALATGAPLDGLALVEAAWARMCEGTRDDGTQIAPNDPAWDGLTAAAQAARTAPAAWLEQRHLYGDLADNPRFADAFSGWLTLMYKAGMSTALHTYLEGS